MSTFRQDDRRSTRTQCAYTVVEVVVSVALLGLLFVALYGGLTSGFAVTQVSRENLRATQIMLDRMEGVRLFNWNQLVYSNWIPNTFTDWFYPLGGTNQSRGIAYTGTMVVNTSPVLNPPASYSSNMCLVTVTVNWSSGGTTRTRSMSTYVSRNGMQNYIYNN